jgi:predicted nucleotidyltransferase
MRPSESISLHRDEIRAIVEANNAKNPRVFGSILSGEDTEDSDLDLLVDTTKQTTLLDIVGIQNQLEDLLSVHVDVVTPNGLPDSFRAEVLRNAAPI